MIAFHQGYRMGSDAIDNVYEARTVGELVHGDFGILPAVDRIRSLLKGSDCDPVIPYLLDHIEDITRNRVKARGQDRPPMFVTVPAADPVSIFDDAIDFLSESSCQQRM